MDVYKILGLNSSIPSQCQICEPVCFIGVNHCDNNADKVERMCLNSIIFILTIHSFLLAFLIYQIIHFWRREESFISLRKLVYQFSIFFSVTRIVRYALLLRKVPFQNLAGIFSDVFLYYLAIYFILVVYSLLLVFWANICSQSRGTTSISWIGNKRRIKILLITTNIIAFIFCFSEAFFYVWKGEDGIFLNISIGIVFLSLSLLFLIEGTKVYRVITRIYTSEDEYKSMLIRRVSLVTITASTSLVIFFVLIFIFTFVDYFRISIFGCVFAQIFYRIIEVIMIMCFCSPFVTIFGKSVFKTSTTTTSSTKSEDVLQLRNSTLNENQITFSEGLGDGE